MAILITGGSTGVGRGIGVRFAERGDDVFVNYHRDDEAALEAERLIAEAGGTPHLVKADVGSIEGVRSLIEAVSAQVEQLDQIVHCAAKVVSGGLLEADGEDVEASIAVNGTALVHLVREALPLLKAGSSVFYITSGGGRMAIPNYGAMGIPKALGDHIIRYLAVELAPRQVRANIVSPGALETPALRALFPDTYKERIKAAADANPSGRGVTFADVAGVVERMSEPEFSMVQGQYVRVDGGISL
jgi:NAD(P)-dependent dehydrogenase (short-subunit alcohol dehydrogenase family)